MNKATENWRLLAIHSHNLNAVSLWGFPKKEAGNYVVIINFESIEDAKNYMVDRIKTACLDQEEELVSDAYKYGTACFDGVRAIIFNIEEEENNG